jgi:diguanylate cyclase (GGDEF)-like protein
MLRKIRSAVLLIYVVIAVVLIGGNFVWLRSVWTSEREAVGQRLAADASLMTSFIQANLIDASKLLDLARNRILEGSERRALDPQAIHQILEATLKSISFSVSKDLRGLLFFIDPNAKMVAQSGLYPAPAYDFSDRLYYRKLIADPSAKFAVGNMLVAKTSGQLVFHISMPVRSAKGQLLGILVQQIQVHDVEGVVREFLEFPGAVVVTRLSNDAVAFVFPLDASPPVIEGGACRKDEDKGYFVADAGERFLIGYAYSRIFDLCSSASLPEQLAFRQFLSAHAAELVGSGVAFLFMTGLFVALLSLVRRLDEEIELSNHDALTGLHNRRFLDAVYDSYCRDAIRNKTSLSVLFLDIDHFKEVNDAYGHPVGDMILKTIGGLLQERVRRPLDVCCRWGGEEFVLLLPDTSLEGASALAREIQKHLRQLVIEAEGVRLQSVTVSIGVISRALSAETATDDLVSLADKAMLEAKALGRNRVVVYEERLAA